MDFRITYEYGNLTNKEMVVKNCLSELHAKIKLEQYLKKKHGNGRLLVITCSNDKIFSIFGDIFKGL